MPPLAEPQLQEIAVRTDAVPIARLTSTRGRWRVDTRFQPPRART
jgi:hypothetical protein